MKVNQGAGEDAGAEWIEHAEELTFDRRWLEADVLPDSLVYRRCAHRRELIGTPDGLRFWVWTAAGCGIRYFAVQEFGGRLRVTLQDMGRIYDELHSSRNVTTHETSNPKRGE